MPITIEKPRPTSKLARGRWAPITVLVMCLLALVSLTALTLFPQGASVGRHGVRAGFSTPRGYMQSRVAGRQRGFWTDQVRASPSHQLYFIG